MRGEFVKEVRGRVVHVVGGPSAWKIVREKTDSTREIFFRIYVQASGPTDGHGFHLCYEGESEPIAADDWYPTLAAAEEGAADLFRISPEDWRLPPGP